MADEALIKQVNENVVEVWGIYDKGIYKLDSGWTTDEEEEGIKAIKALEPRIKSWANLGLGAAENDGEPGVNGWPGWIKSGETIAQGIAEIASLAESARLENIVTTAKETGETVVKMGETVKKTVKASVREIGEATGETVASALKPAILPIAALGLVAIGVLLAYSKAK